MQLKHSTLIVIGYRGHDKCLVSFENKQFSAIKIEMNVMFTGYISVYITLDFGDPKLKLYLKRSEGLKSYQFHGITRLVEYEMN